MSQREFVDAAPWIRAVRPSEGGEEVEPRITRMNADAEATGPFAIGCPYP